MKKGPMTSSNELASFFKSLRDIFLKMDRAYETAAKSYGFRCNGCRDNCCLTHFHHHTHLERLFLKEGFDAQPPAVKSRVREQARNVISAAGASTRIMCPLNREGRCLTYAHRPMICRLHGIPHELRRPGGPVTYGPGCDEFMRQTSKQDYIPFDRTPYYIDIARLESRLKAALNLTGKLKMTVAEMIQTF